MISAALFNGQFNLVFPLQTNTFGNRNRIGFRNLKVILRLILGYLATSSKIFGVPDLRCSKRQKLAWN